MHTRQIEGLEKRKKRRVFSWNSPLPTVPTSDSALLYKLAGACLGRELEFTEGAEQELPDLVQFAWITQRSFIINFTVNKISETLYGEWLGRMLLDSVQIIALCVYVESEGKIRISVFHSIRHSKVIGSSFPSQALGTVKIWYTYLLYRLGFRIIVRIQGAVSLQKPLSVPIGNWQPPLRRHFFERHSHVFVDKEGIARRLS